MLTMKLCVWTVGVLPLLSPASAQLLLNQETENQVNYAE